MMGGERMNGWWEERRRGREAERREKMDRGGGLGATLVPVLRW